VVHAGAFETGPCSDGSLYRDGDGAVALWRHSRAAAVVSFVLCVLL